METLHHASNDRRAYREGLVESPSERALNVAALVAIVALIALAIATYVLLKLA